MKIDASLTHYTLFSLFIACFYVFILIGFILIIWGFFSFVSTVSRERVNSTFWVETHLMRAKNKKRTQKCFIIRYKVYEIYVYRMCSLSAWWMRHNSEKSIVDIHWNEIVRCFVLGSFFRSTCTILTFIELNVIKCKNHWCRITDKKNRFQHRKNCFPMGCTKGNACVCARECVCRLYEATLRTKNNKKRNLCVNLALSHFFNDWTR